MTAILRSFDAEVVALVCLWTVIVVGFVCIAYQVGREDGFTQAKPVIDGWRVAYQELLRETINDLKERVAKWTA